MSSIKWILASKLSKALATNFDTKIRIKQTRQDFGGFFISANIDAAKGLGFVTHLFKNANDLQDAMKLTGLPL
ncbi:MAG: hypothetical protein FD163_394 [Hyphomonadaceae bacterium]|nr:MAG: hypothetical protein FD128_9 [Hyphomonadaceae bacterium]KAF0187119.1 MAG: hypothetical protein FD163_394 [Hyphomonadaceae bacterium]